MEANKLETGDIILVADNSNGIFNYFLNSIKYFTHSNYTHIGFIVKDPEFLDKPLKGIYFWESGYEGTPDPQDGLIKLGVQLTEINRFKENYKNGSFYVRKLKDKSIFTKEKLKEIHNSVYNMPYDINIIDWIFAFFKKDIQPQKINRFWCSAFVGYIFTKCGILKEDTDWSILYPNDFSLSGENLNYKNDNKLIENETKLNL